MRRSNAKRVAPDKRGSGRVYTPRGGVGKSSPKDVSDRRRFAAMNARMVDLNLDINRYGVDMNNAIENHRTNARANKSSPFRWSTPAANPDGSSADQRSIVDRLGAGLNARDINQLEATDKVFRDHLDDLNTIQEWWRQNRKEWAFRRRDIQIIQESIDSLLYQVGGEANVKRSQNVDARKQYYLQVEVADSRLEWFEENEGLQRSVIKKFKDIEAAVEAAVNTFKGLRPVRGVDAIFPANFTFEDSWSLSDFKEDKVKWWRRGRDYPTIATNMRQYILDSMEVDGRMQDTRKQNFDLARQAESDVTLQARSQRDPRLIELDIEMTKLELRNYRGRTSAQDVQTANQLRRSIVVLEKNKRDAERITAENQDYLPILQANQKRLLDEYELLARERPRNRLIREIARQIELRIVGPNADIQLADVRGDPFLPYIQTFYMICRTHFLHTKNVRELLDILQDDDIQADDVAIILELLQIHQDQYLTASDEIIAEMTQHAERRRVLNNPEDIVEKFLYKFEYEYEDMDDVLSKAQELLEARKAELALNPKPEARLREIALGDGALALNKVVPAWQAALGEVRDLAQADNYLAMELEVRNGYKLRAGEALRAFFVSPDITDAFGYTYEMRRDTFLDLVNSLLRTPIHASLLDAFLMRCHNDEDLFKISISGRVSRIDKGWELVDEMPVAGPSRKVRPVKPVGLDDLERWFVKNKNEFITQNRVIRASVLSNRVMRRFPRSTPETFMDTMHFFSQVGRLYHIPKIQPKNQDRVIMRIDNGWEIEPTRTMYPELDIFSKVAFREWHTFMKTNRMRTKAAFFHYLDNQPNEAELFQIVMADLEAQFPGNILGFGKIVPTKHRFHLYLRWCSQNDPTFFTAYRDGSVTGDGVTFP